MTLAWQLPAHSSSVACCVKPRKASGPDNAGEEPVDEFLSHVVPATPAPSCSQTQLAQFCP